MQKIVFKLNRSGVKELLQSDEMRQACESAGNMVAAASGIDCEVDSIKGSTRVSTRVKTADAKAYYENMNNNSLLKALGSVHL